MTPDRPPRDERPPRRRRTRTESEPEPDRSDATGPVSRRSFLRLGTVGVGALAGCQGMPSYGADPASTLTERRPPWSPPEDECDVGGSIEAGSGLHTTFDTRERFRCLGGPVDDMEDLDPWTAVGGTLTADGDEYATGSQSAHVRADSDADRVSIRRPLPGGFDVFDRNPSIAIRGGESAPFGVYVQLFAPDARNRVDLWQSVGLPEWHRLDPGPRTIVGNPNLTDVREIAITVRTGEGDVEFRVDSVRTTEKPDRGRVLFAFDGNYLEQYETAYPVLSDHDMHGTIGTTPETVGLDGRTSLFQLRRLRDAGWDVINSPPADEEFSELRTWEQRLRFRRTKSWLLDNGFESGARFVLWPRGVASEQTLDIGADYYYLGFFGGASSAGVPPTGPLTVNRVDGNDVEQVRRTLELAAEYRTLAVPTYYTIDGDDTVSTSEFREVVEYADELGLASVTPSGLWDGIAQ